MKFPSFLVPNFLSKSVLVRLVKGKERNFQFELGSLKSLVASQIVV